MNKNATIQFKGKNYDVVFNLNVMQAIQEEYGTLNKWAELTDGSNGEPDAKAVIFGFREMINEAIDIKNYENNEDEPYLTLKQIGRLISEIGFNRATFILNQKVIESTQSAEKNA